ncbi:MAG: hypothetical protein ABIH19_00680 [Candidatus Omnitrophota bacterium]
MKVLRNSFFIPVFIILMVSLCYAAVPHLINYQGKLTDSGGASLNGSYELTFRIYDAESAGNLLWQETQVGVVIQKGVFNVLLGSVANLNLAFDIPYFLEIKVGAEVMSPRQRITSAGYAIRADEAGHAKDSDTIGNVGVSITPVANTLLPLDANAKLPPSAFKTYDSGWFAITKNAIYTKTHNLGTTKVLPMIFCADNINGVDAWLTPHFYVTNPDGNKVIRNPALKIDNANQITLYTGNQQLFSSVLNGEPVDRHTAYARIIMLSLE